jgi:predicted permease
MHFVLGSPIFAELRQALRSLRRHPAPAIISIVTLALAIGGNSAVFSLLDAAMLRSLPFPDSDRLVLMKFDMRKLNIPNVGMSAAEFKDLRDRTRMFDTFAFVWPMDGNLTGVSTPERVEALMVSGEYFPMLGGRAFLGRTFGPPDTRPGISDLTVLSYTAWKRLFGGDPGVLGRKVYCDYDTFTIIGVMPEGFRHPGTTLQGDVDLYMLGGVGEGIFSETPRTRRWIPRAMAKLKPGVTLEQAQSSLEATAAGIRGEHPADYPGNSDWTPRLTSLQADLAAGSRRVLLIMEGAALLVLLVCAATVANLLLAKAAAGQREFAIRAALGAGRGTLIRQILIESLVLAVAAGAAGALVAWRLGPALARLAPINLPQINPVGLSSSVFGFTVLITLVTALLAGLAPALHAMRMGVAGFIRGGGWGFAGESRRRSQALLVVGQIGFSLMLLVASGLLLRSFWNIVRVDPGFRTDRVMVGNIWLPPPTKDARAVRKYETQEQRNTFFRELLRRLRAMPGVESAAVGTGNSVPLTGWNATPFGLENNDSVAVGEALTAQMASFSPDLANLLGLRVIAGRPLAETDQGGDLVAVVDQTMASRFWKNESPLGRRLRTGTPAAPTWWKIVGVVSNMKTDAFEAADAPHVYFSLYQRSGYGVSVFVRSGEGAVTEEALRSDIRAIDPDLPVFGVRTMEAVVSRSLAQRRIALLIVSVFAAVTLLLASLGVYGVTAFQVGQRQREFGVRMALGARPGQLQAAVLRRGLMLAGWGLIAGAIGSVVVVRLLRSLMFGAAESDPVTYAGVAAVLVGATLAASLVPAVRAARVDPAEALRAE